MSQTIEGLGKKFVADVAAYKFDIFPYTDAASVEQDTIPYAVSTSEVSLSIKWSQGVAQPTDILRDAMRALQVDDIPRARNILERGLDRYPDHADLQTLADIIAPPKVIKRTPGTAGSWGANRVWLKENWADYAGHWVALQNGRLKGTSISLKELKTRFGNSNKVQYYFL